jgi:hypothetical protein
MLVAFDCTLYASSMVVAHCDTPLTLFIPNGVLSSIGFATLKLMVINTGALNPVDTSVCLVVRSSTILKNGLML